MSLMGIDLQRISLGALIIALGMLVDNAIVVTDGILVGITRGRDRVASALQIVEQAAWFLLGATLVAIMAFAAIGFSPDSTGEYCKSLFQVIAASLLWSWVLAVSVTPLLCVDFLKRPAQAALAAAPCALCSCIRPKTRTTDTPECPGDSHRPAGRQHGHPAARRRGQAARARGSAPDTAG